jgi:hypothetical protein
MRLIRWGMVKPSPLEYARPGKKKKRPAPSAGFYWALVGLCFVLAVLYLAYFVYSTIYR